MEGGVDLAVVEGPGVGEEAFEARLEFPAVSVLFGEQPEKGVSEHCLICPLRHPYVVGYTLCRRDVRWKGLLGWT